MALERPLTAPERRLLRAMQAQEVEAWPLASVLKRAVRTIRPWRWGLGRTHGPWTGAGLGGDHDMVHARHDRARLLDGLLEERLLIGSKDKEGAPRSLP